ncbi:MAG TPA: carbamoyltransferase HypF [Planctomycetota bacterium]|nr:carbamoyltransferase HypF [Planctomycetota bacterium]
MSISLRTIERRRIEIRGLVQGIGFRPFVYRLASKYGLGGWVRNDPSGVQIVIEGDREAVARFEHDLNEAHGPRILGYSSRPEAAQGEESFRIERSLSDSTWAPMISPDLATCGACLEEIREGPDRRTGYPLASCAQCGPRFTIQEDVPYDRERTSMARFPFCPACRAEYDDPGDRRHHAEGSACPECGPRLRLLLPEGRELAGADPLSQAAGRLQEGAIVALKGLGGFHLTCLANQSQGVARLRARKGRDEKPFALMVRDLPGARDLCETTPDEEALLSGPERPIVLLKRRPGAPVAPEVAPGNPFLGVMLPYTPLHHLLLARLNGAPLVMTSGNASDLPIAQDTPEAVRDLGQVADLFLTHDRPVVSRADDSVARIAAGQTLLFRRSRGYTPAPIRLPVGLPRRMLALGGAWKATFALGRGNEAVLSHHAGDLGSYEAYRAYTESITHYEKLFRFSPEVLIHDLHPDYPTTAYALERARQGGLERLAVQHHHAHVAACMAENGLDRPVIGVAFDGTGYGTDGAVWGGEFLVGDCRAVRRAGHLEYVPMPGGEAAIREPWRMALAYLTLAQEDPGILRGRVSDRALEIIGRQIDRKVNAPPTSSMGRLFDGVSALLGVRDRVSYEGQAAIELEWRARPSGAPGSYPVEIAPAGQVRIGPIISGLLRDLERGEAPSDVARRFHRTVTEIIRRMCLGLREETGIDQVVLSGGVFMNELVLTESLSVLAQEGFVVHRHRLVPPNDGGLALGQLAVAAAGGGR